MFSILSEGEITISATFILLSAKVFNLDQSKILPFGKTLILRDQHKPIRHFQLRILTLISAISWLLLSTNDVVKRTV